MWLCFAVAAGVDLANPATAHTDLIRPGRWPKLVTGKTTEAMPVVSISINYVSTVHLAVKKNLT